MKNLLLALLCLVACSLSHAQNVGNLQIGKVYSFECVAEPGVFIGYGVSGSKLDFRGTNHSFKVVAALNGREGFVSLQAIDLDEDHYVVMTDALARPYDKSNNYNVNKRTNPSDATFNTNASFEVMPGRSDQTDAGLVSFRVKNGTHFLKKERHLFMDAPGAAAPAHMVHFTFRAGEIQMVGNLLINQVYTFESVSEAGQFIGYGSAPGRVDFRGTNRQFKVVPALNGKEGFVSLKAIGLSDMAYLVMAEEAATPYDKSNYYNVASTFDPGDIEFNNNASFEVMPGRSNQTNKNFVSFRVKGGTHFLKKERHTFMDAPGQSAPDHLPLFTFKTVKVDLPSDVGLLCESGSFKIDDNQNIHEFKNGAWVHIGVRCSELVCNRRNIYCVSQDGSMWRYNGTPHSWTRANTLNSGQTLTAGTELGTAQYLASLNGRFIVYMQENGDLGIWDHNPNAVNTWSSNSREHKNCTLTLQTDGNLTIKNSTNQQIWSTETSAAQDPRYGTDEFKPVRLVMEDDGKLVLYSRTNKRIWTSAEGKLPLN